MHRTIRPAIETLEGKTLLSASGLAYSLTATLSSTSSGAPVVLTFTETNISNHVINVEYGPGDDGFVATENGKTVWISNNGIVPQYIVLDMLKPGQSVKITATWNGRSDVGANRFPGPNGPPLTGIFVIQNELAPNGPTATVTLGSPTVAKPVVLHSPTLIVPPIPPAHAR